MESENQNNAGSLPVSAYIRTFNEQGNIARAISGALKVADEVIVVDSGSTDDTIAIAERLGARVIHQDWLGWGHQKRVGEEACSHDWLLDLDADEEVSEGLATEIREIFSDGEPDADVYSVRVTTVDPSGRVWRRSDIRYGARLYDRRKIRIPADGAWDKFVVPRDLEHVRLSGELLHCSFTSLTHMITKRIMATSQELAHMPRRGRKALIFRMAFGFPFYFFKGYVLRGLWREGGYGFFVSFCGAFIRWLRDAMIYESQYLKKTGKEENGLPPKA